MNGPAWQRARVILQGDWCGFRVWVNASATPTPTSHVINSDGRINPHPTTTERPIITHLRGPDGQRVAVSLEQVELEPEFAETVEHEDALTVLACWRARVKREETSCPK